MNRIASAVLTVAFATLIPGSSLFGQSSEVHRYKSSEIKQMVRDAHTAQQYQTLAEYFRGRQQDYKMQAYSEFLELERRSENIIGPAAKYPRPVDSSRNRYEYFIYETRQMSQKAEYFESLSAKLQQ